MGIIAELESLFAELELLLPVIDALPLTGGAATARTKIESVMSMLKVAGL
jgi:hypothetical protein